MDDKDKLKAINALNDDRNKLTMIDVEEFWSVFGDINHLLGMLVVSSHHDDEDMIDKGAQAAAIVMTRLVSIVMPECSSDEVIKEMEKSRDNFNAHKEAILMAKTIINTERDFTDDRN